MRKEAIHVSWDHMPRSLSSLLRMCCSELRQEAAGHTQKDFTMERWMKGLYSEVQARWGKPGKEAMELPNWDLEEGQSYRSYTWRRATIRTTQKQRRVRGHKSPAHVLLSPSVLSISQIQQLQPAREPSWCRAQGWASVTKSKTEKGKK
jgi:hypothetical protein